MNTYWLGFPVRKCPFDLWVYQELLYETRPTLVIETGTFHGGSALFFASVCDLLGRGRVMTVDIEEFRPRAIHPRIRYLRGSSTSEAVVSSIRKEIMADSRVMVVLDSDHSRHHVSQELALYADLVTPGCYLVVEDTNINGHPVYFSFGEGPAEAVAEFLQADRRFIADPAREKHCLTFSPGGYLRRIA
jgi:cephalosporin hydroxylase